MSYRAIKKNFTFNNDLYRENRMIRCHATGLVYSNPQPHLKAIHAWHPSLVNLGAGKLLCTFDLGQAAESLDYRTYAATSDDEGQSWSVPRPLITETTVPKSTHTIRVARLDSGVLLGMGARFYRDEPSQGLTNRQTLGFVPMELISVCSDDNGQTWTPPNTVVPPLKGPAFEICHAVQQLSNGTCLFPTQTWPDWHGHAPHGMQAIALVSYDSAKTWPDYITVFDGRNEGVVHFEQSVVEMVDGRLLAVAWSFDQAAKATLQNPFVISDDGRKFTRPMPTGLDGQTAKLLPLKDGRVLCVYRGHRRPGLYAQLVRINGDRWTNLDELLLWEGPCYSATEPKNTSDKLSSLKLGFPSLVQLGDGSIRIAFWCEEESIHRIRWFHLSVEDATLPAPHFAARPHESLRGLDSARTSES